MTDPSTRADDVCRWRVGVRRYRAERLDDRSSVPPNTAWRATLGWTNTVKNNYIAIDGVYSLNLDQPGTLDLNFGGAQRFTLPRGGRPAGLRLADEHRAFDGKRVGGGVACVGGIRTRGRSRVGSARRRAADHGVRHSEHPVPVRDRDHRLHLHGRAQRSRADSTAATRRDPRAIEWASQAFTPRHQLIAAGRASLLRR